MDAIEYVKERQRMCKSFGTGCTGCPAFNVYGDGLCCTVSQESTLDATAQVAIVESWIAEHPYKTRQSIFLEQYPETDLDSSGGITLCPAIISESYRSIHGGCKNLDDNCNDCRHKFWEQEIE